MKKQAWIVVADGAYARIFKLEEDRTLIELETLVHPQSRLKDRDLVTDRPGRTFESHTSMRRSVGQQEAIKKHEAVNFAKSVSVYLNNAVVNGMVHRIYLAASPSFLGLLRQELDKATAQVIVSEIDKEITHLDCSEICAFFPNAH